MAFNAGAIIGTAKVDDSKWNTGIKSLVKGTGALVAAVGTAAVAAMTKATVSANKWQKSLSNVNTLTDEATVNSQDMAKELLGLDARLGDTTELTDAMYQSFSSGSKTMDEAMKVTTDSAKFAKAALTDTSTAVDVLTTAQNAYGKGVVSTEQASDIFFTTIKQGKITGEQLAGTIGQSIPLFSSLGVPLEELGAGMAAMTKQGVNAAESTTQLNAIANAFLKPSDAMSKALEEQGHASGSALLESEGLAGALKFLDDTTGGSKEALSELLPSTRAVRGALALTGTGGAEFTAIMEEMGSAAGATDEAFGEQELTLDTLKNAMNKVELVAGNIGKFFVDDIAEGATKAAEGMLEFAMSGSMAEIVGNLIGGVSAGFEALKTFMDPIIEVAGPGFNEIMSDAASTIEELRGEQENSLTAFDLLGQASQFTALGLEVMLKIVNANVNGIINLINVVAQGGQTVGSFFDMLKGKATWEEVKAEGREAVDAVKGFGTDLAADYGDVWNTLTDGVKGFSDSATETSLELESKVTTTFSNTKNQVLTDWDEMITGQVSSFEGLKATVEEDPVTPIPDPDGVEQESLTLIARLKNIWSDYRSDMELSFQGAFDNAMSAGSAMLEGLSTIADLETQNITDAIELQYQNREIALEEQLEAGLISEEEYNEQLEKLQEEKTAKLNEENEKAFESTKSLKIAEVWMSAAQSIAGWWSAAASLGPIAGPIFAGVMTGATIGMAGTQAGLINEQQFIPSRRTGGPASGLTRVNEAGGELINLPDGSVVVPNDMSKKIAEASGSAGNNTINFNGNLSFGNKQDIDYFVRQVEKKLGRKMRNVS